MNVVLSPKALFRQQEDQAKAFRAISRNTYFHNALSSAIAEFAHHYHPTAEELKGARNFLSVLLNLTEEEAAVSRLPVKTLNHHAAEPPKT